MKKLLSLLLMVLMLLGSAAFAEENEEDTAPVVAPIVTFKSGFYVGYLDREIKITVSCKNKSSATVPEKYLELRNHRGEVLERAFWRILAQSALRPDLLGLCDGGHAGRQQAVRLA